ncbi:MAG: EF-P lysine aminoacylase GenX [Desulfobulbaceae bacterium A2]|nr:MAG: EF-P lysine aminoacylase GenX [Desulfobulbaceae bacterium A2]
MVSLEVLRLRSRLLQEVRRFFLARDYLEVETPIRQPVLIPEGHIRLFASEGWWLQASPELCMKRLLAAGCQKIFQICHCFRRDEVGELHLPEFTMLEWYQAGWDYNQLMSECEELVRAVAHAAPWPAVAGAKDDRCLHRQGRSVDLHGPWPRLTVREACRRHGGRDPLTLLQEDGFDQFLVEEVEPQLGWQQPLFLCDYPIELGSLARPRADDAGVAERFELYLASVELANGFSELNDAEEQERRFCAERARMSPQAATPLPRRFLRDLSRMPAAAGVALGLDRLFMLLCGATSVQAVAAFTPDDL